MLKKNLFTGLGVAGIGVVIALAFLFLKPLSSGVMGNLSIEGCWVRSSTGPNTAAYLTLTNTGKEADRLIKVECPDAAAVELHTHIEEGGVLKMRPVPFIEIDKGSVEMKPGGLHIMLMGLKDSFKGKKTILLTLHFEKAGAIPIDAPVKTSIYDTRP